MIMITHIPTGLQFNTRLDVKLYFGSTEYNRRLKNNEFTFHDGREITNRCDYDNFVIKKK